MTDELRRLPRLFVRHDLSTGQHVPVERDQANYLANVLRLKTGSRLLAFNGRDGEWLVEFTVEGKRNAALVCGNQTRPQTNPGEVHYLFAPLKSARLDYMAQKATELGASRLVPVITRRTQAARVNLDRLLANAVEAAEQCGLLSIPEIASDEKLDPALNRLEAERTLIFCDEDAEIANPVAALSALTPGQKVAVLVGPEGGFDDDERRALLARPNIVRLSLGPRIMRADTAAIAALTLVQAVIGDFGPRKR